MPGPFALAADDYLAAGWHPFPAYHTRDKSKAPCVKAWYTDDVKHSVIGWDAVDVTPALLTGWKKEYKTAQLGLRLPPNVLGIDVDGYDNKTGFETLRNNVALYGPLGETWCSTSKPGTGSGIYLFRVPDSSQFPNDLRGGVELIRWCSRFIMAAPSTHPKTGAPYGWGRPDGEWVTDEFPATSDLLELRSSWVEGLTQTVRHRPSLPVEGGDVREWVKRRPGETGPPCEGMQATYDKYRAELAVAGSGSRHDAALRGVHALVGDSAEGHLGLYWCLARLGKLLIRRRGNESSDAGREFASLVATEVARRNAAVMCSIDPCVYNNDLGSWAR